MQIAVLPGLILALAGTLFAGLQPDASPAGHAPTAPGAGLLFSLAAQDVPTATITATGDLTATVPLTGTTPAATPPPVPEAQPDASLQLNPFDPNFLFSAPTPPMGPFSWLLMALMLGLIGVSGYFYFRKRPEWKRTNSVLHRAASRWGQIGLWTGVIGLLFLLFRVIHLDFFNMRFWLYLWTLTALGLLAWFLNWYRTRYPAEMARFTKRQRARQYMPGAAGKAPARTPASTVIAPSSKGKITRPGTAAPAPASGDTAQPAKGTQQGSSRRRKRK